MKLLRLYIIQNKNKSLIQKCSNTFCNKKVHSLLLLCHIHLSLDHQQLVEGLQRLDHQQRLGIHDRHGHTGDQALLPSDIILNISNVSLRYSHSCDTYDNSDLFLLQAW